MKIYEIPVDPCPINQGERISDALKSKGYGMIPTNVILDKSLTGIGATYSEIKAKRNSIIIEPNVPVIKGKEGKHDNILGVYKGITVSKIKKYLNDNTIKFKKLLTTPESFKLIRKASEELRIDLYGGFFCLFDECEKITQDIGYRKRIAQPVFDFFNFTNKAFVSATPLTIKHPEIEKQGFRKLKITPSFDYRKNLDLIVTNTFNRVAIDRLNALCGTKPVCIFYNSIDGIESLVNSEILGIKSDYKIFCSDDGLKKLQSDNVDHVYSDFSLPLAKYNFFTSRFFSGFDIELRKEKPDLLILTNLKQALFSIIDPFTEAIQIQGRFRDVLKDGTPYNSLTHIVGLKNDLTFLTDEQLDSIIDEFQITHHSLRQRLGNATNTDRIKAIEKDLNLVKYADLLDESGKISYFAIDNLYNEERVKKYFCSEQAIVEAYGKTAYFIVNHISLIDLYDPDVLLSQISGKSKSEIVKMIVSLIIDRGDKQKLRENFRQIYPKTDLIFDAVEKLGTEEIENCKYSMSAIEKKLTDHSSELTRFSAEVIEEIFDEFVVGNKIGQKYFTERLSLIYKRYGITTKLNSSLVDDYFKVTRHNGDKPATFMLKAKRRLPTNLTSD